MPTKSRSNKPAKRRAKQLPTTSWEPARAAKPVSVSLVDDVLLSTSQVAKLVGLSSQTLRNMRCDRLGPPCMKLGGKRQSRTVYSRAAVERWVRESAHVVVDG